MGNTTLPLNPGSRQLNRTAQATATSAGTATFTFDSPPIGFTWTGTIAAPNAPASAGFVASVGLQQWCQWAGEATAGPVQLFANQQLVVSASGLIPGTAYQVVLIGGEDPTTNPPAAVWPDPTTSNAVTLAGAVPLGGPYLAQPSGFGPTIPVPGAVRTLLCLLQGTGPSAITLVTVATTSPFGLIVTLYSQPPYLTSPGTDDYLVIVPLPVICTGVNVACVVTGGLTWTGSFFGDTQLYEESEYYNGTGILYHATATNGTTLVTGPCRLLTGSVTAYAAASFAALSIGTSIIRADTNSATGAAAAVAFPQPFIVPAGVAVTSAITGSGTVSCS